MRRAFAFAFFVLLSAFSVTSGARAIENLTDKDGFKQLPISADEYLSETVLGVMSRFFPAFPSDEEGIQKVELKIEEIENGLKFDLIETGFADDSLRGRHLRGVIMRSKNGWFLSELSQKWLCRRGQSGSGRCL